MNKNLLRPLRLPNGQVLANRFFKSAMSETMADSQHAPTHELIKLYEYWAKQKMGVLVTGNVMVDSRYLGEPGNVVLDSDEYLDLFQKWAAVGQQQGVPIWIQLNHPGKQMYRSINETPIAPSAIPISGAAASAFRTPREMTLSDIEETIEKFILAGVLAQKAGFNGVQLHAAHGYLINQFLSPADNQRTDSYGGSLENRMRFLVEIYQGLREKVGSSFTIALKLNASDFKEKGFGFEDCKLVVQKMSDLGIDLIEISGGNYETPVFGSEYENGAGFVNYAVALSNITSVPIVSTGGFRKVAQMEDAIEDGVAMIGLARPFVLRPHLVKDYANFGDFQVMTPRLTTGIQNLDKTLGPIIGVSYYESQMKRLAKGKSVRISQNAWPYLMQTVKAHGMSALKPRRR
ncbi:MULTISPECIES: NADH:flavin oxidoreductase/NADH oxidase family protein [unclassified Facklamia]|uniref:NADH:flavin oxidoreductase/NADH oxidase family protein n=1 Tax=Aerococcaceae TaxID=186827 RepID=UPI0013B9A679|nr:MULTISPECIES: NADH:flavin oxidoreductase/NADH oxidase family protein [unclassified Facklamia]NEW64349.1 NADH:flavin oxidoreductase [Facklamia sp. 252]NEW67814.1 NADH:flavin oxidoreductase [Facklamia sp. 253]QQD64810.1 NADH:flavin oxidoreductase/NADH oxidase family protein [Aerococcaceae bacterium zg-252]